MWKRTQNEQGLSLALLQFHPSSVVLLDTEGRIRSLNRNAERLLSTTEADAVGKSYAGRLRGVALAAHLQADAERRRRRRSARDRGDAPRWPPRELASHGGPAEGRARNRERHRVRRGRGHVVTKARRAARQRGAASRRASPLPRRQRRGDGGRTAFVHRRRGPDTDSQRAPRGRAWLHRDGRGTPARSRRRPPHALPRRRGQGDPRHRWHDRQVRRRRDPRALERARAARRSRSTRAPRRTRDVRRRA